MNGLAKKDGPAMVISGISAITAGGRVNATTRVRNVNRDDGVATDYFSEEVDEIVVLRKRARSASPPSKSAIKSAAGSPASRSSAGVLEQLSQLKLGG